MKTLVHHKGPRVATHEPYIRHEAKHFHDMGVAAYRLAPLLARDTGLAASTIQRIISTVYRELDTKDQQ